MLLLRLLVWLLLRLVPAGRLTASLLEGFDGLHKGAVRALSELQENIAQCVTMLRFPGLSSLSYPLPPSIRLTKNAAHKGSRLASLTHAEAFKHTNMTGLQT